MSEFPKLLSDDEFAKLLERRHEEERRKARHIGWNPRALVEAQGPSDGLPESTLEQRFAHVVKNLVAMWPSEACRMYLHKLIVSPRDTRQGFPPLVLEDLLMLLEMNDKLLAGRSDGPQT